jgi:hypothetical protein
MTFAGCSGLHAADFSGNISIQISDLLGEMTNDEPTKNEPVERASMR